MNIGCKLCGTQKPFVMRYHSEHHRKLVPDGEGEVNGKQIM